MKHFTLHELTKSATATRWHIDNTPNKTVRANLNALVNYVLDPLREAWGAPIIVTSGYRCPQLNRTVGGAINSQHTKGQAADIRTVGDTPDENRRLFNLIISLQLPFDQLIDEHGYNWIHVSYAPSHRREILHAG